MVRKRTTEEAREYMRQYRAQKRGATHGATSDAGGVTAVDKTPVSTPLDVSGPPIISTDLGAQVAEAKARLDAEFGTTPPFDFRPQHRIKPSFLAAPDDDCAACGHDRQQYHSNLDGVCIAPAPNTRSRRCGCPSATDASEPF